VAAVRAAGTKGIRLVKPELNSIQVPGPASGEGILAVEATPWAVVSIDGREVGETPVEALLGVGAYRIRAANPDLGMRETIIQVKPGKRQVWTPTFTK
jgi:hypothetical protein